MSTIMQSFIIVSNDENKVLEEWGTLCKKNGIEQIDQAIIESEDALGIEEIRNIQKTIFLTPVKGEIKGILVKNAHTLTVPAQNAFLKLLEEPPAHAILVLHTINKDLLLPTILSRCFIIELENVKSQSMSLEIANKNPLELAQEYGKTKGEALGFLENYILSLRDKILKKAEHGSGAKIKALQKAHTIISTTNVNPRLVLENALFELEEN